MSTDQVGCGGPSKAFSSVEVTWIFSLSHILQLYTLTEETQLLGPCISATALYIHVVSVRWGYQKWMKQRRLLRRPASHIIITRVTAATYIASFVFPFTPSLHFILTSYIIMMDCKRTISYNLWIHFGWSHLNHFKSLLKLTHGCYSGTRAAEWKWTF